MPKSKPSQREFNVWPGYVDALSTLTDTKSMLNDTVAEIDWILRIDGHTDRVPVTSGRFASNWELSTVRAVSVVRFRTMRLESTKG